MKEVDDFIAGLDNEVRKIDPLNLRGLLEKVSGHTANLTGSIVGFGRYRY